MTKLFIEDTEVDLSDASIQIDYSIFDIQQIDKRKGMRSYSFQIPKTGKNRLIFSNPDDVTSLSNIPYSKLKARLYADGIDIGIRFCSLMESEDGYLCNLYGGNTDFYSTIGKTKLNELSFCSLNHRWDKATIVNSRTNTSGYIYPLIDYNSDSPNSIIDNVSREITSNTLYPSVFYDDILNLCIDYFGYDFINESPQSDLLLAYSGNNFIRTTDAEYLKVKAETTVDKSGSYNIFHQLFFAMDTLTQSCNFWDIGTSVGEVQLNFEDGVTVSGRLYWLVENTSGSPVNVELWIGSNVFSPSSAEFIRPITLGVGINVIDYEFTVTNQTPDQYTLPIYFTIYDPSDTSVTIKSGSYIDITEVTINDQRQIEYQPYASYGGYVTPTSIFGEIRVIDLIKYYCQMFGLIIVVNEVTKEVRFIKFDSVRDNNSIYDWSDKIDITNVPLVEFEQSKYAQVNNFEYTQDGDQIKPIGTDGSININNDNLPNEATIVQLPFAGSVSELMLIDIEINNIPILENLEIKRQCAIRPLRLYLADTADFQNTSQLTYKDSGADINITTNLPLTYFIGFGRLNNLGFGDSILSSNYIAISEILDRLKVITIQIRLNASDINQLDFTKPVFIKHFNAWFYISQIKGYDPTVTDVTQCELVKLF
jgi:hypothetical protein